MNLLILVDKHLNMQDFYYIKNSLVMKKAINNILNNNTVILDDMSFEVNNLLKNCIKIHFDYTMKTEKLPEFLSPVNMDKTNQTINNYGQLFNELARHDSEKIFVMANYLALDLLPYVENVYQISMNDLMVVGDKFKNLKEDKNWECLGSDEPFFDEKNMFTVVKFRNKKPFPIEYFPEEKINVSID